MGSLTPRRRVDLLRGARDLAGGSAGGPGRHAELEAPPAAPADTPPQFPSYTEGYITALEQLGL